MKLAPTTKAHYYERTHRLTDLRDGIGNTVHFTLDNMDNVTHQEVRGAGGDLVAQTQRTFDALNRLQTLQRDAADPGTSYAYDRGGNTHHAQIASRRSADAVSRWTASSPS